jgi:hypothetical protein
MDNKPMEIIAQNAIEGALLAHHFKVMKPSFDVLGADLLVVQSVNKKSSQFLRIQSKGRSIGTETSNVKIPVEYVNDNFVLFIYTMDSNKVNTLFVFFDEDIKKWNLNDDHYTLSFNKTKIDSAYFQSKKFSEVLAEKMRSMLNAEPIKNYTSILVDGVFLEKAYNKMWRIYSKMYPNRKFEKPNLSYVIKNIIDFYNISPSDGNPINCYVLLSKSFPIDSIISVDEKNDRFHTNNGNEVRLFVNKTNSMIALEVLEQLERFINHDNIILVADDVIYESKLNEIAERGIQLLLLKFHEDDGSRMFVPFKWGDIIYPLALSVGIQRGEF